MTPNPMPLIIVLNCFLTLFIITTIIHRNETFTKLKILFYLVFKRVSTIVGFIIEGVGSCSTALGTVGLVFVLRTVIMWQSFSKPFAETTEILSV